MAILGDLGHAFAASRVQHISDLHFNSHLGHAMCRNMVDIQSVAAAIRRGEEKEDRKKLQGKNIMAPLLHRAAITSVEESCDVRVLLYDNALAHTSAVATSAAAECGYELLPHPPHSPHLAPSDFYLFPLLKEHVSDTFLSDNDVIVSGGLSSGAR